MTPHELGYIAIGLWLIAYGIIFIKIGTLPHATPVVFILCLIPSVILLFSGGAIGVASIFK